MPSQYVSITRKIIALFILIGLVPLIATVTFFIITSKESTEEKVKKHLISIRELKKEQIEIYFEMLRDQAVEHSQKMTIINALNEFTESFFKVEQELNDEYESNRLEIEKGLRAIYEYQKNNTYDPPSDALSRWWPEQRKSQILQYHYIYPNLKKVGHKDDLPYDSNSSTYSMVHKKYHHLIARFLEGVMGYNDVFLVEPESGYIVYSVLKQVDFATSLLTGPYRDTNLAQAFKAARASDNKDFVSIVDFSHYEPSYNQPEAFIASPIFHGKEKIGILVYQLPIDTINELMTSQKKWKDIGWGSSAETYIVGQDFTMRNDSRFLIETSSAFFKQLRQSGYPEETINKIRSLHTTILLQKVKTAGAKDALRGRKGVKMFHDYRNIPVLSAYTPLDIKDITWALISKIDKDEAFESVYFIRNITILVIVVFVVLVAGAGIFTGRAFSSPIKLLSRATQEIGKGNLRVRADSTSNDEIGQLVDSFNTMAENLQKITVSRDILVKEIEERKKVEKSLQKIKWLLSKKVEKKPYKPYYGNLTALNRNRLILDSVGEDVLRTIADDYMDLLETSAAVYEKNGDYALGIFSSGWCQFLDLSSRALCNTEDNREALESGKWGCHESCWSKTSKVAIETGKPVDIECFGGIHLYAVPIRSGEEIVGAIDFGYGDPPKDPSALHEIAQKCNVDGNKLLEFSNLYDSRPPYIIALAKKRLVASAKLIGEIINRARSEKTFKSLTIELERRVKERTAITNAINKVFREAITCETEEELGHACLNAAEELTGSKFGLIGMVNEKGFVDDIAISNPGWDACTMAAHDAHRLTKNMPIRGVDRAMIRDGKSRILNGEETIKEHPDHVELPEGHPRITAFLGVPLKYEGKTIGMIGLGNKEGGYTPEDRDGVESLSAAIVEALRSKENEQAIKELNEELKGHAKQLEEVNKELESFSYSVSHDLRAPLRHISGFMDLLQQQTEESLGEESRRYFQIILESVQQMGKLIDDLLNFSRTGRVEIQKNVFSLKQVVDEVIYELKPDMDGRHIEWKIETLPEVYADKTMMRLVIVNLISNAIKFTSQCKHARIEIGSTYHEENEIVFFIRDNGVGFDMKYVNKLFGVFHRLHRTSEFEGTGIGLANVQRIIHRHGGRTWAAGSVGKGAVFYFSLPQSKGENI